MSAQPTGSKEPDYYRTRPMNLVPSADLGRNWVPVAGPVIRGWSAFDRYHQQVGRVEDVLIDTDRGRAVFAILQRGVFRAGRKQTLVPVDLLDFDEDQRRVIVQSRLNQLNEAPDYDPKRADYAAHYDYWTKQRGLPAQPETAAPQTAAQAPATGEQPLTAEQEARLEAPRPTGRRARIRILRPEAERAAEGEEEYTVSVTGDEIIIETGAEPTEEEVREVRSRIYPPPEEETGSRRAA